MRVVRLIDGAGTNGLIRREVWDVLMVPDAEMGWRAVRIRLDGVNDGPWAPPPEPSSDHQPARRPGILPSGGYIP